MLILGIGGLLHDGAAALLQDGELVAAMEEEKLLRESHAGGLPSRAIDGCLKIAGATYADLECVALARPLGTGGDPSFHLRLKTLFPKSRIVIVDHHTSHAAGAFYPSPFEQATVLTLDRMGDVRCGAIWEAQGSRIEAAQELYAPDAPAAFYSRITELLGFRTGAEEHKVQWLSVDGKPRFHDLFVDILGLSDGRLPQLDHSYFDTSRTTDGASVKSSILRSVWSTVRLSPRKLGLTWPPAPRVRSNKPCSTWPAREKTYASEVGWH